MNRFLVLTALALGASASAATGAAVYQANCAGCHQATGKGVPGAFPPLAGHFTKLLAAGATGRAYVGHVALYGLQGSIKVNGQTYAGVMPGQKQLSDADLAAVLNHVATSFGNKWPAGQKPFTAAELAKLRAKALTPAAVLKTRPPVK
ncbi:mono/diheme cytochrome c family protein [Deinococcus metalli]|uniref:Cytochrome c-552 n=1 Tax=Deinococcus metalli TaxID=1141878 RepID=A0A7W8KIE0_9DEIO|nr:cytochrome c [Deinococcus metalli]MBB5378761.1 mono/diheme cytochrome c family protein [Deinococcus metalli]GHF60173.1 cytochrome c-552 [Deinococcus metalli]